MIDQLIRFETAKLAVQKGFDIIPWHGVEASLYSKDGNPTNYANYGAWYGGLSDGYIPAPTQALLQRWLREKHQIHIELSFWENDTWSAQLVGDMFPEDMDEFDAFGRNTYEDALEIALVKALNLIDNE